MKQKVYHTSQEERRQLIRLLAQVLKNRRDVEFAYVYGSFVEDLPFHDVDVGVYVSDVKEEDSTRYMLDLAQRLSQALGISVDVRVLNFAPVPYLYHVIRGDLIFERNEELRMRVVERTIRRYLDLKPMIRMAIKEAFAA